MPPLPRTPLLTPRLLLRPYEAADAGAFYALLHANRDLFRESFPDRTRTVSSPADVPAALQAFADDWHTGRFYVLGIWHRHTTEYLGDICLMPNAPGTAEIGYYLGAQAQGHGYAREALAAVVSFGFEQVGVQKLLIRCYADNLPGQKVALAAGFVAEQPPRRLPWFRASDAVGNIRRFVLLRDAASA
jgi:RimJ/RimL family protein N-acetyltransferase